MRNKKPQLIAAFMLATFAIGTSVSAQQSPFKLIKKDAPQTNSYKKAQQFLKAKHSSVSNKPTTLQQRVLSQTFLDEDNLAFDSTTYTYSNMRGSEFDYYYLDFAYNTDHESGIVPIMSADFYSEPKMSAFADTIKGYQSNGNGQYNFSVGYYRADNQLDSIIEGSGDNMSQTASYVIENTFNAAGKIQSTKRTFLPSPTNYSINKYSYNSAFTLLLEDTNFSVSGGTYQLNTITSYKYNTNNQLDSIITFSNSNGSNIIMVDFSVFSYYPNGKILSTNSYELGQMSSNFDIIESDTFSYFTNFDAYETLKLYSYDEGQLFSKVIANSTLGANSYPDSLKAQITDYDENDSFKVSIVFEYNSFNNPIKISQYENDTLAGGTNFHYQEYDDSTTAIKPIANNSFEIFPNPITNQIKINNKSDFSGLCSISLTDLVGRTVFEKKQSISVGQNVISIPKIAKGIYILELQNGKGVQFSQKVVKE